MNHCVPDFDMDEYYSSPPSPGISRPKNMQGQGITELVWHNGQLMLQNQNQRLFRKSPPPSKSQHNHQEQQQHHQPPSHPIAQPPPPPEGDSIVQLFMQEDEMTSWLNCPVDDTSFDRDLTDLLYHPLGPSAAPLSSARAQPPARPPPPPASQPHHNYIQHQTTPQPRPPVPPATVGINFPHFARLGARFLDSGASTRSRNNELTESTVDSSDTPAVGAKSGFSPVARAAVEVSGCGNQGCESMTRRGGPIAGTSTIGGFGGCMSISRDAETCEQTITSSAGGSGASASATATVDLVTPPPADDRKRKGREPADDATTEYQSEDLEIESSEGKKQSPGPASAKRSRAAEVHNLSERRRRDRINEKMKALQELIPRCSKTDKASMLDEAIEYLKSLQLQVQMMSMGCGMVPMVFPGVQQYMPPMGMGIGIGMGMGMEMGINRPMMPFPAVPNHFVPRFPHPTFPMPPVPAPDLSRIQPSNQVEMSVNQQGLPGPSMFRMPTLADPYIQYLGGQQMPVHVPQDQPTSIPSTSKPSTSRESEDDENHQNG